MGVLSWIIFGLIAGIIAKLLMPGRDPVPRCSSSVLRARCGAKVRGPERYVNQMAFPPAQIRSLAAFNVLPLSTPALQEVPRAPAQIPTQIMALRKQRIPLTHCGHQMPPG